SHPLFLVDTGSTVNCLLYKYMGVTSENVTPMSDDTQPLIRTIDSLSLGSCLSDSGPQKGGLNA
ncbi:MAG: hypothetical protein SOW60_06635, partial [Bacteroidaceae bacterium]|nr:hypothetical protein [Bacteroidaceae bacterium]